MPRICVVGLGPGDPGLVTSATLSAINEIQHQFLRTTQHPSAHLLSHAQSFDHLYDAASTFDEVYVQIAEQLVVAAHEHDTVLYAVPGSPSVLERSVQLLRQRKDVVVEVFAAVSFLDCSWTALGIDPIDSNVRLIDGHLFAQQTAGDNGPFLVAHCHANWVLSDIKLAAESEPAHTPVVLLHHVGLPDEKVVYTTWSEIDRTLEADHLTSLYIPRLSEPVAGELVKLHQLARTLREQCPWDKEQTHESLIRYLIEETYEVVDALQALQVDDPTTDDNLIEELGDLLYQVEFHAAIAEEEGRFTMADIARTVHDKLVRRHPHVFANVTADTAEQVSTNWDAIKKLEKPKRTGIFDGVVQSGPSLLYAQQLQKKASKVGFDWPDADGPLQKIHEETNELREAMTGSDPETIGMELGDLLFSVVNVARHLGLDAEVALRSASQKFQGRVEAVQALATERGIDMTKASLEELDALWNSIKLR
ncbi:MAG: nucleoside triphosphate pyrophosphohydrolase [Actinomycetes bacterium]